MSTTFRNPAVQLIAYLRSVLRIVPVYVIVASVGAKPYRESKFFSEICGRNLLALSTA